MSVFLDTNILLYSISNTPAEREKRHTAQTLASRTDCVLSVQVLQEFYAQATRQSSANPVSHSVAIDLISGWRRFPVAESKLTLFDDGMDIKARTGFSIWDAMIVAAARQAGCAKLYTEDMQHGRLIDSVAIVNPFR